MPRRSALAVLVPLPWILVEAIGEARLQRFRNFRRSAQPTAVEEAIVALLWLTFFDDHGQSRAWKTFERDAMDRLRERGLIYDPKSKAKSLVLTDEGKRRARDALQNRVTSAPSGPAVRAVRGPRVANNLTHSDAPMARVWADIPYLCGKRPV